MFAKVDTDGSGEIGYSEFVIATLSQNKLISNQKLLYAFKLFDMDGGGTLTKEEVYKMLMISNPDLDSE
jgi:calcium-dependent protein kinase